MKITTHHLFWYNKRHHAALPPLTDPRGCTGDVEVRVRSYYHEEGMFPREDQAVNEQSFMLLDAGLVAFAVANGKTTWDEDDLRVNVGRILGEEVV